MRSHRRRWIARRSIDLVMLVLLIAGLLKAYDIPTFAAALRTWTFLPKWGPLYVAPVIPVLEITIALAWFLDLRRRLALGAAAIMLIVFTLVYTLHLVAGESPDCGCLGVLEAFADSQNQAQYILMRNAVLLGMLLFGARTLVRTPGANSAELPGASVPAAST